MTSFQISSEIKFANHFLNFPRNIKLLYRVQKYLVQSIYNALQREGLYKYILVAYLFVLLWSMFLSSIHSFEQYYNAEQLFESIIYFSFIEIHESNIYFCSLFQYFLNIEKITQICSFMPTILYNWNNIRPKGNETCSDSIVLFIPSPNTSVQDLTTRCSGVA